MMKNIQNMLYLILRGCLGGELSTDRPSRLPMLVRYVRYGAISLLTSFSPSAAGLRAPKLYAARSIFRTLVRVSPCTLHYFAAVHGKLRGSGLTWEVARHYNDPVSWSLLKHNAVTHSRQAPLFEGFCRL